MGPPRTLAVGDIWGCDSGGQELGGGEHMQPWCPGLLLSTPQCCGGQQRIILPQMSVVPRLKTQL